MDLWDANGYDGLIAFPNLGKKSVEKVRQFIKALEQGDRDTASMFLPFHDSGYGLSLCNALRLLIVRLSSNERGLLDRRLGKEMTLEESAESHGITRERVRQIEVSFLTSVRALLDWFTTEHDQMLAEWMDGKDWISPLRPFNTQNDEVLIAGTLGAIFRETPHGVARALQNEAQMDHWRDVLLAHPDILIDGVNLETFLVEMVPAEARFLFCDYLTRSNGLRLDHATGLIYSTQPSARRTVLAILAREDDPIPLTWLVKLLNQIPSYRDWTSGQLRQNKSRWKKEDAAFPHKKILWNE